MNRLIDILETWRIQEIVKPEKQHSNANPGHEYINWLLTLPAYQTNSDIKDTKTKKT